MTRLGDEPYDPYDEHWLIYDPDALFLDVGRDEVGDPALRRSAARALLRLPGVAASLGDDVDDLLALAEAAAAEDALARRGPAGLSSDYAPRDGESDPEAQESDTWGSEAGGRPGASSREPEPAQRRALYRPATGAPRSSPRRVTSSPATRPG